MLNDVNPWKISTILIRQACPPYAPFDSVMNFGKTELQYLHNACTGDGDIIF